ncbi:MAG: BrnA antitoxin family protein [Burkholderiaceae bacterium]|nr:BrnA antitoxin family protein [Burkholderiaceae bacterium]
MSTTIRFDQDVLAALKSSGPRWQSRANELLRGCLLPAKVHE